MGKLVDLIAGARPNFMKVAPIIEAIGAARAAGSPIFHRFVHTGQHYDRAMSGTFFDQLGLPEPDVNFNVGPGTAAEQTAGIMLAYERLLTQRRSDLCIVVGDVTSTLACAISAQKAGVAVAHVEGGIRSGDWSMPEEINRLATDAITNYFFTTSETANENLRRGGVGAERILFVGNTMIDTLLKQLPRLRPPEVWNIARLQRRKFFVLTLHRPSNVDDENKLTDLLEAVVGGVRENPIIFPVHPRTKRALDSRLPSFPWLHLTGPLGYLEFNYLVQNARAVITDSGGVTEEATILGVPCLTLRNTTERPETVTLGTNELVGSDPACLASHLALLFSGRWKKGSTPPLWDGRAGERIVAHLQKILA